MVDEDPGEHEPGPAADPEHRRHRPDRRRHPFARELVADDADGQREDRAARALDGAPGDHHRQRAGDGRDERPDAEDGQRDEQPVLAVHVARRPSSGVAIDDVSRKAVSSRVASAGPAWNSLELGSAGMTIVWASE